MAVSEYHVNILSVLLRSGRGRHYAGPTLESSSSTSTSTSPAGGKLRNRRDRQLALAGALSSRQYPKPGTRQWPAGSAPFLSTKATTKQSKKKRSVTSIFG